MASVSSSLPGGGGGNIRYTSQLINDGEFPDDAGVYVEDTDLPGIVGDIIVSIVDDMHEEHDSLVPITVWEFTHKLKKKPSVTLTDTAGTVLQAAVTINDGVNIKIEFNNPTRALALLN